jgi:UDPglucose--hexose-1-phosphate uridylyltransferase
MDFQFLQNPITKKWVVSAPRRAKRPDVSNGEEPPCPFCPAQTKKEDEIYIIPTTSKEESGGLYGCNSDWKVRVIYNKYPFAPVHELIIHSPNHFKSFENLSIEQIELIYKTYRQRYEELKSKGQVYIFHNRGQRAGESLPHAHTQLVVVPNSVEMQIPQLDADSYVGISPHPEEVSSLSDKTASFSEKLLEKEEMVETDHFYLFCPHTSEWPDEVWVAPKNRNRTFGEISDAEIADFSKVVQRLIQVLMIRHSNKFSFNYYIYPGKDWYLRLIPRVKRMGGFELGTGIFVNTQDPKETIAFLKAHFHNPDEEEIRKQFPAEYPHNV